MGRQEAIACPSRYRGVLLALLCGCAGIASAQYGGVHAAGDVAADQEVAGKSLPLETGATASTGEQEIRPFGFNLFTGGFSAEKEDGINPDYVVTQGDVIELRVWGAAEQNEQLTVDPKGNVFIPKVGPVQVAGVRNDRLNQHITAAIRKVYTEHVQVYTSLRSSQPVAVFVTGFVNNPGRFAGVASNSILYFIDRAGGVDPDRGSYREIRILRRNKVIAVADLYAFLVEGRLPTVQLKDGDTLVVEAKGNAISVGGSVRNPAIFELKGNQVSGEELLKWCRPSADATHAFWKGIRSGNVQSSYLDVSHFAAQQFVDGDEIEFLSDLQSDMIALRVEGAFEGQSRYVVKKGTRLGAVLDMIAVNTDIAAFESVSIRRKSIQEQQRASIEESLSRLENAYLLASSATDEEARIRSAEAQMITNFVQRARNVEPSGRLVLGEKANRSNILLQADDVITIPERSETVLITGEVLIPQAVLHDTGKSLDDYVAISGGYTELGDPKRVLLVRQNGEVLLAEGNKILPSDQILVLPQVPSKTLQFAKEIVDVIYKVAVSAGVLVRLD